MVFLENGQASKKKKWMIWYNICFKYSEAGNYDFQDTDFKCIKFSTLIRFPIIKSVYFIYV